MAKAEPAQLDVEQAARTARLLGLLARLDEVQKQLQDVEARLPAFAREVAAIRGELAEMVER